MSDSTGGPYLKAALLCEKVLVERDGVNTLVRIIDRFVTQLPPGAEVKPVPVSFYVVLMFVSGFARQKMDVKIELESPSQRILTSITNQALFQGDDQGVNIIAKLNLDLAEEGLYWMGVYLGEQLMTRVPLRWLVQQTTVGSSSPPEPQQ